MKTTKIILRTTILLSVIFGLANLASGQTRMLSPFSQSAVGDVAKIKTYQCPNGKQALLVYNPAHPNLQYFGTSPYSVKWYMDGVMVGENVWLVNVCGQDFEAVIINEETGWVATASFKVSCGEVDKISPQIELASNE